MGPWEKLRQGQLDEGLSELKDHFEENAVSPSAAKSLGLAYLWLRQYLEAYDHFDRFRRTYPWSADFVFVFAGASKWCEGDQEAAIKEWEGGIDCEYADVAGGISIPLMLAFAATLTSNRTLFAEARQIIEIRLQGPRRGIWPTQLGGILLGHIDFETAKSEATRDNPNGVHTNELRLRFWEGVAYRSEGNAAAYLSAMLDICNMERKAYSGDADAFLGVLSTAEYFLARSEAERVSP